MSDSSNDREARARTPRLSRSSPILRRLLPDLVGLASASITGAVEAIPGMDGVTAEYVAKEIAPTIVVGAMVLWQAIEEGRSLSYEEVAAVVVPAVERLADDQIPMGLLIAGFYGGVRAYWREVSSNAQPEDLPDLLELSELLLDLVTHVSVATAETHADVVSSIYTSEREARRELCCAILRGDPTSELIAARADVTISAHYDIVALTVDDAGPNPPMIDNVAKRRRMRRAQQVLDELAGSNVLTTFDGISGIALLPVSSNSDKAHSRYSGVACELAEDFGTRVIAGLLSDVPRSSTPESAGELTELCHLALRMGRPTGTYRIDDLMLEYQLSRPSLARNRMVEKIHPLLEHPHLVEALEAHIRFGHDRKKAAEHIHLHPNSLSYRLRRVGAITGLDPNDANDSRLLAAALMVHRIDTIPESTC